MSITGGDIRVTVCCEGCERGGLDVTLRVVVERDETISVTATLGRNVDITSSVNAKR